MEQPLPILIYLSGPVEELDAAIGMSNALLCEGFLSFIPAINFHQKLDACKTFESWLALNLVVLGKCDMLLRLKGESEHCDAEIAHARFYGIPIFDNYRDLMQYIREGS